MRNAVKVKAACKLATHKLGSLLEIGTGFSIESTLLCPVDDGQWVVPIRFVKV